MQKVKNKWVRLAFWMAFGLIMAAFIILPGLLRWIVQSDQKGAIPREGVAAVAILVPSPLHQDGPPSPPQVSVRFQGELRPVKEVYGVEALKIGQPATIIYRVGKSGRIYVDRVEPLVK